MSLKQVLMWIKDRYKQKADYYLSIPRFIDSDLLKNGSWPLAEVVKTVDVDGVHVGALSKYTANQQRMTRKPLSITA